jgi:hypothetical protein
VLLYITALNAAATAAGVRLPEVHKHSSAGSSAAAQRYSSTAVSRHTQEGSLSSASRQSEQVDEQQQQQLLISAASSSWHVTCANWASDVISQYCHVIDHVICFFS